MSPENRTERPSRLSLITPPRTLLWAGLIGPPALLGGEILVDLAGKLVEGAITESSVAAVFGQVRLWVAIALVVLSVGYVIWRWGTDVRERWRIAQDLALTADLVPPPPPVSGFRTTGDPEIPEAPEVPARHSIAAILYDLPVDQFEVSALYDVVAAILSAPGSLPDERLPDATVVDEIDKLKSGKFLVGIGRDRLHLAREPKGENNDGEESRGSVTAAIERSRSEAALPALVRHYADRAARWAVALDSIELSAGAQRWFATEEEYLRDLITKCVNRLEAAKPVTRSDATVVDLARIADALDLWHSRIGLSENAFDIDSTLVNIVDKRRLPEIYEALRIRSGEDLGKRPRVRPFRYSWSLRVRWEHRYARALLAGTAPEIPGNWWNRAARKLRDGVSRRRRRESACAMLIGAGAQPGATATGDAPAPTTAESDAERRRELDAEALPHLERAWSLSVRPDVPGQVTILLETAVVQLRLGHLDAAWNRLTLAEALTDRGRDPSGRAHTFETMGVLWWMRGEPRRALRCWQTALDSYRKMEHDLGIGRCLQHLGSAMLVVPECGGLLLAGDLTEDEVLRQASGWLAEAESRRRTVSEAWRGAKSEQGGVVKPAPGAENLPMLRLAHGYRDDILEQLRSADRFPGLPSDRQTLLEVIDRWPSAPGSGDSQ
ncbi:hypothetical protein [Nocardia aurantia]|uniref:Tetratricopeptide repeat protein n=1 Tax=Nocardia aurantia TaxID=2585199 RepID=A0A7K0DX86_9NOCA|nr:hypothetical protein [Nocardia aurantia]MQY30389.1 hypothetical protein [Nocardia aurantia]